MNKLFLLIFWPFFFYGCIIKPDYVSTSSSFIMNSTIHYVEIFVYRNGVPEDVLWQIAPGDTLCLADQMSVYGKSLGSPYGYYLSPFDSVVIWFDSLKSSKHQRFTDTTTCERCIPANSNRAISNPDSWVPTVIYENKHIMDGYFTYTITEQDYLNAR